MRYVRKDGSSKVHMATTPAPDNTTLCGLRLWPCEEVVPEHRPKPPNFRKYGPNVCKRCIRGTVR